MSRLSPFDLHLFHEGTHQRLFEKFGAHPSGDGVDFAVWLPGARYVSVIGDFNGWDKHAHPMVQVVDPAIWETHAQGAAPGSLYKFYVEAGESAYDMADPFAYARETGGTASAVADLRHDWKDRSWQNHRHAANSLDAPIAICACDPDTGKEMGFTHVLLPRADGFLMPETTPPDLAKLIERVHHKGLGAALEVVPAAASGSREERSIADSNAVFWTEVYHADLLIGRDLVRDDGWHEALYRYLSLDPVVRRNHHDDLVRRMDWAFDANFVLPAGASSAAVPGDEWQKLATERLVLAWTYALPGKKLIQPFEADHIPLLIGQLNYLYRCSHALFTSDHWHEGFRWIERDNAELNIVSFLRRSRDEVDTMLFLANFSPVPRLNYRVGVPARGLWREVLNTDAAEYGGQGHGNFGGVETVPVPLHGERYSITVTVPPLAGVFLKLEREP